MEDIVKNKLKAETKIIKLSDAPQARKQIKSVQVIDAETGIILKSSESQIVHQNGSGFVISYTAKMCEFLEKVNQGATVRIFLYIAHHQSYGTNGIFGYRCTRQYLSDILKLDRKTVYSTLKYLLDNYLIVENRFDGSLEFMVNPDYVTIGTDKKARMREWSERWKMYFKNVQRLKQNKSSDKSVASSSPSPNTSVVPTPAVPTIPRADFNTFLLHAEKFSNGQNDFARVLSLELKEKLNIPVLTSQSLIDDIESEPEGDVQYRTRLFLSRFDFIVKEDNVSYRLNRFGELDTISES